MRDSAQRAFAGPKRSTSADNVALAAVRWRWPMWSGFAHKNRTQRLSFSQLPEFKGVVRASGIFDSHRPLHFQATPGHVGLQDWRQHIDPMGRPWEFDAGGRRLTYPHIAPGFIRTVTRSNSQE